MNKYWIINVICYFIYIMWVYILLSSSFSNTHTHLVCWLNSPMSLCTNLRPTDTLTTSSGPGWCLHQYRLKEIQHHAEIIGAHCPLMVFGCTAQTFSTKNQHHSTYLSRLIMQPLHLLSEIQTLIMQYWPTATAELKV